MDRSIAFYQAFLDVKPCSEVRLARDTPPPVIIVSDAQAVPRACPGGGYLLADPLTGVRWGWLVFTDELLEASQSSTVAIQEGANPIEAAHDLQLLQWNLRSLGY